MICTILSIYLSESFPALTLSLPLSVGDSISHTTDCGVDDFGHILTVLWAKSALVAHAQRFIWKMCSFSTFDLDYITQLLNFVIFFQMKCLRFGWRSVFTKCSKQITENKSCISKINSIVKDGANNGFWPNGFYEWRWIYQSREIARFTLLHYTKEWCIFWWLLYSNSGSNRWLTHSRPCTSETSVLLLSETMKASLSTIIY